MTLGAEFEKRTQFAAGRHICAMRSAGRGTRRLGHSANTATQFHAGAGGAAYTADRVARIAGP